MCWFGLSTYLPEYTSIYAGGKEFDHDAQLIALTQVKAFIKNLSVRKKIMRETDQATLLNFKCKLSFETWGS
jgi:hypothetical protein